MEPDLVPALPANSQSIQSRLNTHLRPERGDQSPLQTWLHTSHKLREGLSSLEICHVFSRPLTYIVQETRRIYDKKSLPVVAQGTVPRARQGSVTRPGSTPGNARKLAPVAHVSALLGTPGRRPRSLGLCQARSGHRTLALRRRGPLDPRGHAGQGDHVLTEPQPGPDGTVQPVTEPNTPPECDGITPRASDYAGLLGLVSVSSAESSRVEDGHLYLSVLPVLIPELASNHKGLLAWSRVPESNR